MLCLMPILNFVTKDQAKNSPHGVNQDVNDTDGVADRAFMGSAALVPLNQEKIERYKPIRKPTQKSCRIRFHSWKRGSKSWSQKWSKKPRRLRISRTQQGPNNRKHGTPIKKAWYSHPWLNKIWHVNFT